MNNFLSMHHASVIVADVGLSLDFYCGVLGMTQLPRADLPYPGAWLAAGEQQIHLLELPNPDPTTGRPTHGGRDRHVAFMVKDLQSVIDVLAANNIDFTLSRSGRKALFCRDPDGNAIELIEAVPV